MFECNLLYFDANFIDICSKRSNKKNTSLVSDNVLAPNRRQAIVWANDSIAYGRIYALFGLTDLGYADQP